MNGLYRSIPSICLSTTNNSFSVIWPIGPLPTHSRLFSQAKFHSFKEIVYLRFRFLNLSIATVQSIDNWLDSVRQLRREYKVVFWFQEIKSPFRRLFIKFVSKGRTLSGRVGLRPSRIIKIEPDFRRDNISTF